MNLIQMILNKVSSNDDFVHSATRVMRMKLDNHAVLILSLIFWQLTNTDSDLYMTLLL